MSVARNLIVMRGTGSPDHEGTVWDFSELPAIPPIRCGGVPLQPTSEFELLGSGEVAEVFRPVP